MWTITSDGMFSAVQHRLDADLVVVRARVEADAEFLAKYVSTQSGYKHDVVEYVGSDYPVRVIMTKREWASYCFDAAMGIDYGNFKAHVEETQGRERELIYSRVWTVLLNLERFNKKQRPGSYAASLLSTYDVDAWYPADDGKKIKGKKRKKSGK